MTLYVLRHGIAEDAGPAGDDRSRRLTARGRARLVTAAKGMRALGLKLDLLATSPLPRAAETAAIVAAAFGGTPAPRELRALEPGVGPAETVRALRTLGRHDEIMIVGHEPGLSGVVSFLLTGSPTGMSLTLKKGGLVAVEVGPHGATLRWMLTPRQLRGFGR